MSFNRNLSNKYKLSKTLEALNLETFQLSNQIVFNLDNKKVMINVDKPSTDRTLTIPEVSSDCNFLLSGGNQTIDGELTINKLFVTGEENQLILGGSEFGHVLTINSSYPSSSVIYTFPYVGQNASILLNQGTHLISSDFSYLTAPSFTTNPFFKVKNGSLTCNFNSSSVANCTLTFPCNVNATIATDNNSLTLTNKTLSSSAFTGTQTGTFTHSGQINNTNATQSTSTTTGAIVTSGGLGVARKIYVGNGIHFPTTGGTSSELNYYEENTFTMTFSGIWASNFTGTARFVRCGKLVTLYIPNVLATTNTSWHITVTGIPARILPTIGFGCFVRVNNNNTIQTTPGWFDYLGGSNAHIYRDCANSVPFSSGVICGVTACVISWLIN